jgi:lipopolysaccharide transport system permease protein
MKAERRAPHRLTYLRDLVRVLVARDLKLRYKRSVLGVMWSLLNPLLQLFVFYFVFRFVLPVSTEHFATFLFTGLLAWNWFSSSLQSGCGAITDHSSLVRQPGFVPAVLPLVTVLSNLLHFLIALPIVFIAMLLAGRATGMPLLFLPLIIAVQFLLTLSLVYALAAIHVTFRDTQYLLAAFLLLGFYVSPILYSVSAVPARFRWVYTLNPLSPILEGYRQILLRNQYPDGRSIFYVGLFAVAILTITYSLFTRASLSFVEEIG